MRSRGKLLIWVAHDENRLESKSVWQIDRRSAEAAFDVGLRQLREVRVQVIANCGASGGGGLQTMRHPRHLLDPNS